MLSAILLGLGPFSSGHLDAPVGAAPGSVQAVVAGSFAGASRDPRREQAADPDASRAVEAGHPLPTSPELLTGYQWPLIRGRLTQPYGFSPWGAAVVDGKPFHDGIDLATSCGDRIVAAHDGVVLAAGRRFDDYMGWLGDLAPYKANLDKKNAWAILPLAVVVDDGNGYRSMYAHFERLSVQRGDRVRAGQLLGLEGATGHASGCHLHYGLFSPDETALFGLKPSAAKRLKLPYFQKARIDPLLVLPPRPEPPPRGTPNPTPAPIVN